MSKGKNKSWKDVVSSDAIPIMKWIYKRLMPQLAANPQYIRKEHEMQLYEDWDCPNWHGYYDNGFDILSDALERILSDSSILAKPGLEKDDKKIFDIIRSFCENPEEAEIDGIDAKTQSYIVSRMLPLLLSSFAYYRQLVCLAKFSASVQDLVEEIQEGNDDAIFDLISIDPSFLELPEIQERVRIAVLTGENEFFKIMGKSMQNSGSFIDLTKNLDDLALIIFWEMGFEKVGIEQFGFFLGEVGMKRFSETSSLRRKLNRLNISVKK